MKENYLNIFISRMRIIKLICENKELCYINHTTFGLIYVTFGLNMSQYF